MPSDPLWKASTGPFTVPLPSQDAEHTVLRLWHGMRIQECPAHRSPVPHPLPGPVFLLPHSHLLRGRSQQHAVMSELPEWGWVLSVDWGYIFPLYFPVVDFTCGKAYTWPDQKGRSTHTTDAAWIGVGNTLGCKTVMPVSSECIQREQGQVEMFAQHFYLCTAEPNRQAHASETTWIAGIYVPRLNWVTWQDRGTNTV